MVEKRIATKIEVNQFAIISKHFVEWKKVFIISFTPTDVDIGQIHATPYNFD
jgi:hypothetical protein